ncbi:hypothetical protein E2C01_092070 [Portunus trituberculatus]|uniref:Uncharacterized protein n=1 Tax=Portunus trituberculatus TaxID=210409 RepID=A0A5B7JKM1_PORTR|nr:hypothetical protein [Portunus trituberculatus]
MYCLVVGPYRCSKAYEYKHVFYFSNVFFIIIQLLNSLFTFVFYQFPSFVCIYHAIPLQLNSCHLPRTSECGVRESDVSFSRGESSCSSLWRASCGGVRQPAKWLTLVKAILGGCTNERRLHTPFLFSLPFFCIPDSRSEYHAENLPCTLNAACVERLV